MGRKRGAGRAFGPAVGAHDENKSDEEEHAPEGERGDGLGYLVIGWCFNKCCALLAVRWSVIFSGRGSLRAYPQRVIWHGR